MGTDVRQLPPRIAAVSVGVLWGRKHRDRRPEQLPVTEIGVVLAEVSDAGLVLGERIRYDGAALKNAPAALRELELPLVVYNGLRFDWVALDSLTPAGGLITATIDIYSALHPCVAEVVEAEGQAAAFPSSGEYGVLHPHRVAETNLGWLPGGAENPIGEAVLAAQLWHHFVTVRRAVVAGRTHVLSDEQLATLSGARPVLASEQAWRDVLAARPSPTPYRRRTRHPVTFPRVDQRYV